MQYDNITILEEFYNSTLQVFIYKIFRKMAIMKIVM